MSITANLFQAATLGAFQVLPFVRAALSLSAFAGLAMFFKPLLTGIVRALVLVVRPRLSKEEKLARRHMRDALMLQRMIN
ncbi:MAG: hypothetical protein QFF03_14470, partial [Pseudomonadota bacterium]|nr:hypothetical protein [Pseudomonadota bacterium]